MRTHNVGLVCTIVADSLFHFYYGYNPNFFEDIVQGFTRK
jgi:hypothetical protein